MYMAEWYQMVFDRAESAWNEMNIDQRTKYIKSVFGNLFDIDSVSDSDLHILVADDDYIKGMRKRFFRT